MTTLNDLIKETKEHFNKEDVDYEFSFIYDVVYELVCNIFCANNEYFFIENVWEAKEINKYDKHEFIMFQIALDNYSLNGYYSIRNDIIDYIDNPYIDVSELFVEEFRNQLALNTNCHEY